MKILVVHEVSYRKKVLFEFQEFAERLAGLGHEVTVVDFDEGGDHHHRVETVSRTGVGSVVLENTPYRNLPLLKYLSGRLEYERLLKAKLEAKQIDVVWLYSVMINGTNTVSLCRRYGVPVVYRVLDAYHRVRRNPWKAAPLYLGERYVYAHADVISPLNDGLVQYVKQMIPADCKPRFETIEHGVDTDHFKPAPRDPETRRRLGIRPDARVLLFLGTTYTFSGLGGVLEQLKGLRRDFGDVVLLIIGRGEADQALRDRAESLGLNDALVHAGLRDFAELPKLMVEAEIALLPFELNAVTRDIVPCKVPQYLACGLPTVATPLPDVRRLFPDNESGIVYSRSDRAVDYAARVGEVLGSDSSRETLSRNAAPFVKAHFSITKQIQRLVEVLESAVQSATS